MNTPNYEYDWQRGAATPDRVLFDEGLRQHMLRVYNYMGLGLVMTGLVAFIVGTTPALYVPIFSTPLKWVVMFAPLAFVLFFSFRMESMSASGADAVLGLLRGDGTVAGLNLPRLHRHQHRPHVLHRGRDVRRHEPLRLHH
jgi:hypothetical protein